MIDSDIAFPLVLLGGFLAVAFVYYQGRWERRRRHKRKP
jgi:hypothetical protein